MLNIAALQLDNKPSVFRQLPQQQQQLQFHELLLKDPILSSTSTRFRVIPIHHHKTIYENQCIHIYGTFSEYNKWINDELLDVSSAFCNLPKFCDSIVGIYADYKHFSTLFSNNSSASVQHCVDQYFNGFIQLINSSLDTTTGTTAVTTDDLTLWLGSKSVYTPLHYDSYGCNVVLNIAGKKRWRLYRKETLVSYKTLRIPYEESSVYSTYDPVDGAGGSVVAPDYEYILDAGDVLYVPKHMWHIVTTESDSALSVNCWIPMYDDKKDQLVEATTRLIYHSITNTINNSSYGVRGNSCKSESDSNRDTATYSTGWVNPSEVGDGDGDDDGDRYDIDENTMNIFSTALYANVPPDGMGEDTIDSALKHIVNELIDPDRITHILQTHRLI